MQGQANDHRRLAANGYVMTVQGGGRKEVAAELADNSHRRFKCLSPHYCSSLPFSALFPSHFPFNRVFSVLAAGAAFCPMRAVVQVARIVLRYEYCAIIHGVCQ